MPSLWNRHEAAGSCKLQGASEMIRIKLRPSMRLLIWSFNHYPRGLTAVGGWS